MEENNIFEEYIIDYLGKYSFYEEDDFKKEEDGEFILEKLKDGNRFDYKGYSYSITKFSNISKGETLKDITIRIEKDNINVFINNEEVHLNLLYKFTVKELEDHIRIGTRISEKGRDLSVLIYVSLDKSKEFLNSLEYVKDIQNKYFQK